MMKIISVIVGFIMIVCCAKKPLQGLSKSGGGGSKAPGIRVLCYNIHHANPPSRPDFIDMVAIANVIKQEQPDLVALQEVDAYTTRSGKALHQAEELGRLTGMKVYFAKAIDYGGGEYGVAILSKFPMDAILGPVLGNLGTFYAHQGLFDKAEVYLQRACVMAQRDGYPYSEGYWLYCIGKLRYDQGKFQDAIDYLQRAVAILRPVKAHVHLIEAMQTLALAHARLGSGTSAFETMAEWMQTYIKEHDAEMQERMKNVQELRIKERREKDSEISRLRNVELSQAINGLQQANAELRDLAAEKDEFMAIAAHDLRNPLGDSRGMLQTIISHYDVLDKSDLLSLCHDLLTLTMRMSNTVHAFLEITRTDKTSTRLVIQPLDLTLIINRALERHVTRARSKSISIEIEISKKSLWATGDASVVDAVIDNLVSNALKYAPSETVIIVGVGEADTGPFISVCDTGPGVAPDKQHLLFTKYATLGAVPTGGEESLGLGLYLAQRMAHRMGSRITYETIPDKGACFILHLLP
ncbi:MAG: tetratricopeptide repeat protein [Candidatus Kapabacteria bacterium]|nr:tetratricopeptide repeat protein [Candidatus Kapabacteria bacterium]